MTLIPGDGIGPEVAAAARRAVDATGVEIEWDLRGAGTAALAEAGSALPDATVASVRDRGAALKGPVATPRGGRRSVNLALRDALGLHTGIRPCRVLEGVPAPLPELDVVVARMTDGDLYAGIEYAAGAPEAARLRELVAAGGAEAIAADAGISLKPISRAQAERAARRAMSWAEANGRLRVTVVHKATVMRATDGLFLDVARTVAEREFPALELDDRLVDSACHDLVRRPARFDVLLAPMMYGDLLSDLCAGLTGGLGMAPGATLGDGCAVFEALQGTAPRLAASGRANPMAMTLSGAMLLRHLGEAGPAQRLEDAVAAVVREGRTLTYDLRPDRDAAEAAGTDEVAGAIVARLRA